MNCNAIFNQYERQLTVKENSPASEHTQSFVAALIARIALQSIEFREVNN